MDTDDSPRDSQNNAQIIFPPIGKGVFVRHDGRDRLACRDEEGNWRDYYDKSILKGEVIYRRYN